MADNTFTASQESPSKGRESRQRGIRRSTDDNLHTNRKRHSNHERRFSAQKEVSAMLKKSTFVFAFAFSVLSGSVSANGMTDKLNSLAQDKIRGMMSSAEVVNSVKAQNTRNADLAQADIDKLDKAWRAETKKSGGAMIDKTISNDLSAYLKKLKSDAKGLFTEIFVMDNRGLNVGQSDLTSDYWQGDEAMWKETFLVGADAVHISKVEFDESSQTYQAQVSVAISDPETKTVIGAATFGVNADAIK